MGEKIKITLDSVRYPGVTVYTADEFPEDLIRHIPILHRRRSDPRGRGDNPPTYLNITCAFDIETTTLEDIRQSFLYIWQFAIGHDTVVIGRSWDEWERLLLRISSVLGNGIYLIIYVHNLSYEFQFLRGVYPFRKEEVFAVKSRKVLKATMHDHFELRDSYLLTNSSLDKFTRDMNAPHAKVDKELFDYTVIRTPSTPITGVELEYCVNDVLGLVEAVDIKMAMDDDNLYSIPLTQTGYVRRDMKKALRPEVRDLRKIMPELSAYKLLRQAFQGGNCHANRYYAGDVLTGVRSFDRSSSYPDVLVHCEFPMTPFRPVADLSPDNIIHLIDDRHQALVMRVAFDGLRLADPLCPVPYLSKSKCRSISGGRFDNGRILEALHLETTITDIDLKIILSVYEFDGMEVLECERSGYAPLPKAFRDLVIHYYRRKTELKGVAGEEADYMRSKERINSLYGMTAQDPVKASVSFTSAEGYSLELPIVEIELDDYRKSATLPYQWGVWCTAWARYRLQEGLDCAGHGVVYTDTDSVKFIDSADFDEFNAARIRDCLKSGGWAVDPKGVTHYMGVFEEETAPGGLAEFKTLGAKKYAYRERPGDPLVCTISGVPKKAGSAELDRLGGMAAFEVGTVLYDGQLGVVYNDEDYGLHTVNGETIRITANACLLPDSYTIGITDEYSRLLTDSRQYNLLLITKAIEELEDLKNGNIS